MLFVHNHNVDELDTSTLVDDLGLDANLDIDFMMQQENVEDMITGNWFLDEAKRLGIYDIKNATSKITIFCPPDKILQEMNQSFEYLWNHHVCNTKVDINGPHSVCQIRTLSNMYHGIYYFQQNCYIGGIQIQKYNIEIGQTTIHFISNILPDIRFAKNDIFSFPIVVLSHQKFCVRLEKINAASDVALSTHFSKILIKEMLYQGYNNICGMVMEQQLI